jgi:hypothetical protein
VFAAAAGNDLTARLLLGPGSTQALNGFFVIAEVTCGFEDEIAINNPKPAITRGADLKSQFAVLNLASLQNIASTCGHEIAFFAGDSPGQEHGMRTRKARNLEPIRVVALANSVHPESFPSSDHLGENERRPDKARHLRLLRGGG